MRKLLIVIAYVLFSSTSAFAAFDPSPEDVCSAIGSASDQFRLDPRKLVKHLLREVGLDDLDLDKNAHDLTYENRVSAILDPQSFCARGSCREGAEEKLRTALAYLQNYFMRHTDPLRSQSPGIQITAFGGRGTDPAAQFLRDPSSVNTICVLPPKSSQQAAKEQPFAKTVRAAASHVRVRSKAAVSSLAVMNLNSMDLSARVFLRPMMGLPTVRPTPSTVWSVTA
jgi:hypothetical protein